MTARPSQLFGREVHRIHCVGVGGMGVGPLAIYLARIGYAVSGEDDALTEEMRSWLTTAGVAVRGIPPDCDLVACSSAIAATHPAWAAAAGRNLPVVRRGELLAEVTRDRKLVAVCGSHGKTTTTAMLVTALRSAGVPAGYVLGGLFSDATPPADAGTGEWVVAEVDESDGTIDRFAPELTVAVNLDWDHPDHYRRRGDIEAAFAGLFTRTRDAVLVSDGCAMSARVVDALRRGPAPARPARILTFGPKGDFRGEVLAESRAGLTLRLGGRFAPADVRVRAHGGFNASNATAALAAARLMGATMTTSLLAEYAAVRRRQSVLPADDILVVEDYAHHPAEIDALLGSLRRRVAAPGRLLVVFQPHRFSRTAQFKIEFGEALAAADRVYLLDVYPAGEAPVPGGTTADVRDELARQAPSIPVAYCGPDEAALFAALSHDVGRDDLVAFVGAGDIDRKARSWLAGRASPLAAGEFIAAIRPAVSPGTVLRADEPLAPKTTIRVGGAARIYAEPASLADLQTVVRAAAARRLQLQVLGRGSNLIVPDTGVDGVVVALAQPDWAAFEPLPEGRVRVGAGLRLKSLCGLAAKAGLAGFEFLEGIPGTVGGALRMNAGAMGGWIFDLVEEVTLVDATAGVRTLPRSALHAGYRRCEELAGAIAVAAVLRPAAEAEWDEVRRQMDVYARRRHETQPREPSAGCVFKNPPGDSAGRLIDAAGLKGERVGDAEVSPVHANFIVNRGNATSTDVLDLIRRVRARVRERHGIELQPEVLLFGRSWEDVL